MGIQITASVMCADQCNLLSEVRSLEAAQVDSLHFDVMDGSFVQNFCLGFPVLEALRPVTVLPFEVHLMIRDPDRHFEKFVLAGADILIAHVETAAQPLRIIERCRSLGKKVGLALNPATPPTVLEYLLPYLDLVVVMTVEPGFAGQRFVSGMDKKIRVIRELSQELNPALQIEVDGSINEKTIPDLAKAGAEIFVGGTSGLFRKDRTFSESVRIMRASARRQSSEDSHGCILRGVVEG